MKREGIFGLFLFFVIYGTLLLLSWGVQIIFPIQELPHKYERSQLIKSDESLLQMHYHFLENDTSGNTIVLFYDDAFGIDFVHPLAEELRKKTNVLIPLYPSDDNLNRTLSHSAESRAGWTNILVDSLGLENIHLAGQGYGGLPAIHMAAGPSNKNYQSMTLLSSLGVQELHFLGNYTLNRSLYSLLYPVVLAYEYLIPHFGWFYQQSLDKTLIYTNMQLDQRNIREKLKQVDLPVMVLHALKDRYVPLSSGEENHRLLPQSYFITENARHLDIKKQPGLWSKHIEWFIKLTEEGRADTRMDATRDRIAFSEEPFDPQKMDTISGWGLAMIMLLLAIISLVSEDLSCIAGGLVVASGILDFEYALLACFGGIFLADINIYFLGRWVGRPIAGWIPFRWFIKEEDIERMEELFEMRGVEIIFASRFLPGTRFPAYLAAGLLRINFLFFLGYFLLSLVIWTPLMVWLSALIGQPMLSYLDLYQDYAIWIILAIIFILYGIFKVLIPLSTVKGRRKLVTKWRQMKEKISDF